jgi:hypothetical protein
LTKHLAKNNFLFYTFDVLSYQYRIESIFLLKSNFIIVISKISYCVLQKAENLLEVLFQASVIFEKRERTLEK